MLKSWPQYHFPLSLPPTVVHLGCQQPDTEARGMEKTHY